MLMLGTVLADTYELRGWLGSGGMGQVFDAQDLRLDRRVAVKVARPAASEALRGEGRVLAAIKHPSVVGVLHAGTHKNVEHLVMERIFGSSLRATIDERRRGGAALPLCTIVTLLRKIARGLAVVHHAGLSHRDLKPENVMLAHGDRVVLTDFGLTRPECVHGDDQVSGSPNYMAPEVITRSVRPGDGHLVDLYALGIVAYELLVGRTPFERAQWAKTLEAHLAEPAPDPRELRCEVPESLADLVLALLAKEPRERPDSAESVLVAMGGRWSARRA
jgi:serine/threonine-protein kinase